MSNGLNVILSVNDLDDINEFLNAVKNESCRKFVWAINPNKEFIRSAKSQDISLFCNRVNISKQKEFINETNTSEYDMYKRNIRFKALNRMLFFQYNIAIFKTNDSNKIEWDYINASKADLIIKNNDFFIVKNNIKTKKFFYDFEEYIVFLKDLKEGRNLFSFHNFKDDIKLFNDENNYNLVIDEI